MFDFRAHAWPTIEEERARSWRCMPLVVQVVFFVLTIVAITAVYNFCRLIDLPPGWVTAIASIATAEILIRRAHFWRTGVESALWIGGLVAFIVALPNSEKPEAILLFAAAAAISGWRVRNALFGALALVLVTAYLAARDWEWLAALFACFVSLVAVIALTRSWRRPSTQMLWQVLVVVMPVAGYGAVKRTWTTDGRVLALFVVLSIVLLLAGIRFRLRAVLIASIVALAIAIIEARDYIPLSAEVELIVVGALTLAVAALLMRALRGKETGFVIGERKSEDEDALQIAAMLPIAVPGTPAPEGSGGLKPGGGEFGGAGASGDF